MTFDMEKVLFTGSFKGIPTQRLRGSVPNGYYAGKIANLGESETNDGAGALRVDFSPVTGDHAGAPLSKTYRFPREDDLKDFMWQVWRALLVSVGYTESEIDAGIVKLSGKALMARGGNLWFHCAEAATEEDFPQYTMLAKAEFDTLVAAGGTGPKARPKGEKAARIGGDTAENILGGGNGAATAAPQGSGRAQLLDRALGSA